VNSHYLRHQLINNYLYFKNKTISVVPQAIEVSNDSVKKEVSDKDECIRILTVTNLNHEAKYNGMIELTRFLQKYASQTNSNHKLIFNICGGGNFSAHLRKRLELMAGKQNKLCIRYFGFVKNIELMYKWAHIFLYTSYVDSLPRVLLEAQAYGLPILVNDFEAFKEIIRHGYNGLLYRSGNFEDFKKKLDALITCPNLRHFLSKNSLENLKQHYSPEVIGKRLKKILVEIISQNK